MDPLSAIGLASSIVTLVDLGAQAVKVGREIHDSVTGQTAENGATLRILNCLDRLPFPIPRASQSVDGAKGSPYTPMMMGLAEEASLLSSELRRKLLALQANPHSTWSTVVKSARVLWSKGEIKRLEDRFAQLSVHITACCVKLSSDASVHLSRDLAILADQSQQTQWVLSDEISQIRQDLQKDMQASAATTVHAHSGLAERLEKLNDLLNKTLQSNMAQQLLDSLAYDGILSRRDAITTRHSKSFDWIFEDEHVGKPLHFKSWLASSTGIFWITGKPGSGKSTLMKWICSDTTTEELLRTWSSSRTGPKARLVLASFFCSYTGGVLKSSREALMRSLLFEIYQQCPDLISYALNNQQFSRLVANRSWTSDVLTRLLDEALDSKNPSTSFCFFIDGLDEYCGPKRDVTDLVKHLSRYPNVKICISSRPWPVFEALFGQDTTRSIAIHEHTLGDIKAYVDDLLGSDLLLRGVNMDHELYDKVSWKLQRKSEGVFIWIFLTVRNLRERLADGLEAVDLERQIEDLPADLEGFFADMISRVPPAYHESSAKILLTLASCGDMPLLSFSSIDKDGHDPLAAPLESKTNLELDEICSRTKKVVVSRCMGLVQSTPLSVRAVETFRIVPCGEFVFASTVEFVHKSVFDFLKQPGVASMLYRRLKPGFDPLLAGCEALLAALKVFPDVREHTNHADNPGPYLESYEYLASTIRTSLTDNAAKLEVCPGGCANALLDEASAAMFRIERTSVDATSSIQGDVMAKFFPKEVPTFLHGSLSLFANEDVEASLFTQYELGGDGEYPPIFYSAIHEGILPGYVEHCVVKNPNLAVWVRHMSPLALLVLGMSKEQVWNSWADTTAILKVLLGHGANPNQLMYKRDYGPRWSCTCCDDITPWEFFLALGGSIERDELTRCFRQALGSVTFEFIRHGADLNARGRVFCDARSKDIFGFGSNPHGLDWAADSELSIDAFSTALCLAEDEERIRQLIAERQLVERLAWMSWV